MSKDKNSAQRGPSRLIGIATIGLVVVIGLVALLVWEVSSHGLTPKPVVIPSQSPTPVTSNAEVEKSLEKIATYKTAEERELALVLFNFSRQPDMYLSDQANYAIEANDMARSDVVLPNVKSYTLVPDTLKFLGRKRFSAEVDLKLKNGDSQRRILIVQKVTTGTFAVDYFMKKGGLNGVRAKEKG